MWISVYRLLMLTGQRQHPCLGEKIQKLTSTNLMPWPSCFRYITLVWPGRLGNTKAAKGYHHEAQRHHWDSHKLISAKVTVMLERVLTLDLLSENFTFQEVSQSSLPFYFVIVNGTKFEENLFCHWKRKHLRGYFYTDKCRGLRHVLTRSTKLKQNVMAAAFKGTTLWNLIKLNLCCTEES